MAEVDTARGSIPHWYAQLLEQKKLRPDPQQEGAAKLLNSFADQQQALGAPKKNRLWSRLTNRPTENSNMFAKGIYMHGGVGRGKTFLMDEFFLHLSLPQKRRVHFHAFMRHFHQGIRKHSTQDSRKNQNAMEALIEDLAQEFGLICFDEFHISDIADAMILARILKGLLTRGTRLIMTSNYAPQDLYKDGLARHLFLPTIELIEKFFIVFDLGEGLDYRQTKLADNARYFHPLTMASRQKLSAVYDKFACGSDLPSYLEVGGRKISAVARCSDSIWFNFSQICGGAYGKEDYLRIAEKFNVVFVSDVPRLNDPSLAEASRRFTWLIDILYDAKCILVMSAAAPLNELYGVGDNATAGGESGRTLSRLVEMQAAEYLAARKGGA